jgi:hypothetical protein
MNKYIVFLYFLNKALTAMFIFSSVLFKCLNLLLLLLVLLFTAIGFAPSGSSPTLVQTKTIKQHYTVAQHDTIKRKQHDTIKRKQNNTYIIQ